MMRCSDCSYWEPSADEPMSAICRRIADASGLTPEAMEKEPTWIGGPGCGKWLHTTADFGCLLFDKRKKAAA